MLKILPVLTICMAFSVCSLNSMAAKASDVFAEDSDPILVGKALPFTIKMLESLAEAKPKSHKRLETTGSLYIMYANAFVQGPAEQMPQELFRESRAEKDRAVNLYLRGLDFMYRRLELKYPGFSASFQQNKSAQILAKMKKNDVPSLYWAAVAGISAYSLRQFDPALSLRHTEFLALAERAYELDPDFNKGALDEFLFLYYMQIPEFLGGDKKKAEIHFNRAMEKSGGLLASIYVSYATAVSIPNQDYDKFKEYIEKALSVDIDASPSNRLVNVISQKKAQYLLDSAERLFIFYGEDDYEEDDWYS